MRYEALLDFSRMNGEEVLHALESQSRGLTSEEVARRRALYGPNRLPDQAALSLVKIFFGQFLSPLIYVLVFAALLSWYLGHNTDALFIFSVILLNAVIGCYQEYRAEKSAQALRQLSAPKALVVRGGEKFEINANDLVPGDWVILTADNKVPADIRLFETRGLEVDESTLTGESQAVIKDSNSSIAANTPLAEISNSCFAGTLVTKGQGQGIVVKTGFNTELGKIASQVLGQGASKTPLMLRMAGFTKKLSFWLGLVIFILCGLFLLQGQSWDDTLLLGVALAVDAIPEGLPVALTVALAVASKIMANHKVIARRLSAVEALGSCDYICSDKTGTLTANEQTASCIWLAGEKEPAKVSGVGLEPKGGVNLEGETLQRAGELALTGVLCNEGQLYKSNDRWTGLGDAIDVALLVLGKKLGCTHSQKNSRYEKIDELPYISENAYSACLYETNGKLTVFVKGSLEKLLEMSSKVNQQELRQAEQELAESGYRVLALAKGEYLSKQLCHSDLSELTVQGLVGFKDPLRAGASEAVEDCHNAGIKVVMITGDHPSTALSIAKELGMANSMNEVAMGKDLRDSLDLESKKVFARVSPRQKLDIVTNLKKRGHFVAVTGDGANDAPALKASHVGVAMGLRGTDIAKESSDLIISDDHFASIVRGIFYGRVAYNNVRKVTYLLLATGAAEIVLFSLSVLAGLPMPLTAVQILWVNLVTNGIQDVALAFEPSEGDELKQSPRKPTEPLVDRSMVSRLALSSIVMGGVSFYMFHSQLSQGAELHSARNIVLLMMVLFGNLMIGNCRSETKSVFRIPIMSNPLLLISTLMAQALHLWAMQSSWFSEVLKVEKVTVAQWFDCLLAATSVLIIIELQKFISRRFSKLKSRVEVPAGGFNFGK